MSPLLAVEINEPTPSFNIVRVLPHRLDALLEESVITAGLEQRRRLQEVVQTPEILNGVAGSQKHEVRFPVFLLVVLEIPHGPPILQGVFGDHFPQ